MPPSSAEQEFYRNQQENEYPNPNQMQRDYPTSSRDFDASYPPQATGNRVRQALDDSDMHLYDEANSEMPVDGYSTFPRRKPPQRGTSQQSGERGYMPEFKGDSSQRGFQDSMQMSRLPRSIHELQGEMVETALIKGDRGLGVTIIGGENDDPLQIKSIVPGGEWVGGVWLDLKNSVSGPAEYNGQLQAGDILVYVNDTDVMTFTHDQVIDLFQSIRIGSVSAGEW